MGKKLKEYWTRGKRKSNSIQKNNPKPMKVPTIFGDWTDYIPGKVKITSILNEALGAPRSRGRYIKVNGGGYVNVKRSGHTRNPK